MKIRLAVVALIVVAACNSENQVAPKVTKPYYDRQLVGPNVKVLLPPKDWPAATKIEKIKGVKKGNGCDPTGKYTPIAGLYQLVSEVDVVNCDMVVGQYDWQSKIDQVTSGSNFTTVSAINESVSGPQAIFTCDNISTTKETFTAWYNSALYIVRYDTLEGVVGNLSNKSTSYVRSQYRGWPEDCVYGNNGNGTSMSINNDYFVSNTLTVGQGWNPQNCGWMNCSNSHKVWFSVTNRCNSQTDNWGTSSSPLSMLATSSEPFDFSNGSPIWVMGNTLQNTWPNIVTICSSSNVFYSWVSTPAQTLIF